MVGNAVFSKTALTISLVFGQRYDLQFEWNLFFRNICYLEILDFEIVKIWLFSYNSPVQSMHSCYVRYTAMSHYQLINNPTHITEESSSCIDLIFATRSNLIRETGVELSIFEKCHHNLIYGIIDFKVLLPASYLRVFGL